MSAASHGGRVSGTDIFLSYARHDRATARTFAQCLAEEGFSVWWDASLHSGETFDEVIERKLKDAKAVVVLWSPRSVASRWVRAEATLADRRNKLAPAIIEPCDRPIIFELTHAADLSDWTGDTSDIHWRTFVQDLHRLVEAGNELEGPAEERPATKPRSLSRGGADEVPSRPHIPSRRLVRSSNDSAILRGRTDRPIHQPHVSQAPEVDAQSELHCLEIDSEELPEDIFVIESSGVKIGRSAPADIVLSHKSVSREHC